ncbi:MAG: hypothetical protein AB1451_05435 [Nitrospirota bacterium]
MSEPNRSKDIWRKAREKAQSWGKRAREEWAAVSDSQTAAKVSEFMARGLEVGKSAAGYAVDYVSPVAAFLSPDALLRWSKGITEGAATVYDRALDATYLRTHIGGGEHRLFDGGHGLVESWKRAAEARPDDETFQEIVGWLSALWKDGTTLKGLPFVGVSKESFDAWADHLSSVVPGVSRDWLYDLLSPHYSVRHEGAEDQRMRDPSQ